MHLVPITDGKGILQGLQLASLRVMKSLAACLYQISERLTNGDSVGGVEVGWL